MFRWLRIRSLIRQVNAALSQKNTGDATPKACAAATALGEMGAIEAVEVLAAAVSYYVRPLASAAAQALGKLGDRRGVEPLINALASMAPEVFGAAAVALTKIGDARAVEPLIALLSSRSMSQKRDAAVEALGDLRDRRAVAPLLEAWKKSSGSATWVNTSKVVAALGKLGDPAAIPPLVDQLKDAYRPNRREAMAALQNLGWTPADRFQSALAAMAQDRSTEHLAASADSRYVLEAFMIAGLEEEWLVAVPALEKLGDDQAAEMLASLMVRSDCSAAVVRAAAGALGRLKDKRYFLRFLGAIGKAKEDVALVKDLVAIVESFGDETMTAKARDAASHSLCQFLLRQAGPYDVDSTHIITEQATVVARGLVDFGDARAVDALLYLYGSTWNYKPKIALPDYEEQAVRSAQEACRVTLQTLAPRFGAGPLLDVLKRTDLYLSKDQQLMLVFQRAFAAELLGTVGDKAAVEPLIATLREPQSSVAEAAARSLGQLGDSRAIEPLRAALAAQPDPRFIFPARIKEALKALGAG